MTAKKTETGITPAMLAAAAKNDIANLTVAATPGGIERQEAQGQRDFVARETLPIKTNYCTREQLEKIGIKFGEQVDDLFVRVQLPQGWKIVPTAHSMWSHLVDDKGRERAGIFYKAAFYDRDAHISLSQRFVPTQEYIHDTPPPKHEYKSPDRIQYVAKDCGKVVFTAGELSYEDRNWDAQDALKKQVRQWLNQNFPQWEDPTVYWE